MKIFQTFRNRMAALGSSPNQSLQTHPFNERIAIGTFILSIPLILQLVFFCQESHIFYNYTRSICLINAEVVIFTMFLILLSQLEALFELIIAIESLCDGKKISQIANIYTG